MEIILKVLQKLRLPKRKDTLNSKKTQTAKAWKPQRLTETEIQTIKQRWRDCSMQEFVDLAKLGAETFRRLLLRSMDTPEPTYRDLMDESYPLLFKVKMLLRNEEMLCGIQWLPVCIYKYSRSDWDELIYVFVELAKINDYTLQC
ncbi:hypothetical protein MW887_006373 [Aspergillus wentii]|nr:hypothetical protein MW887_006373 [Aspergillus wentii]